MKKKQRKRCTLIRRFFGTFCLSHSLVAFRFHGNFFKMRQSSKCDKKTENATKKTQGKQGLTSNEFFKFQTSEFLRQQQHRPFILILQCQLSNSMPLYGDWAV